MKGIQMADQSDDLWRVFVMPNDPRMGGVQSGPWVDKPEVRSVRSDTGAVIVVVEGGDEEPLLMVSMRNAMSVFLAKNEHIADLPVQEGQIVDAQPVEPPE